MEVINAKISFISLDILDEKLFSFRNSLWWGLFSQWRRQDWQLTRIKLIINNTFCRFQFVISFFLLFIRLYVSVSLIHFQLLFFKWYLAFVSCHRNSYFVFMYETMISNFIFILFLPLLLSSIIIFLFQFYRSNH